jgi:uncharacterized protein
MPRPKKCRRVCAIPQNLSFTPSTAHEQEVVLSVEELEAIRLSDLKEMEQDQAAVRMRISRGTLQRILNEARRKVSDALVYGKAIRIAGGHYEVKCENQRCPGCMKKEDFQIL